MPATLSGFIIDVLNFVVLDALAQTSGRIHHAQSKVSEACCRKMSRILYDMSRNVANFMIFYDALILQKTNIFCRDNLSQNVAHFLWRMPQVNSHLVWPLWVENDSAPIILEIAVSSKAVTTCSWHVMASCASWGSKRGPCHAGSSLTRSIATKIPDPFTFQTWLVTPATPTKSRGQLAADTLCHLQEEPKLLSSIWLQGDQK